MSVGLATGASRSMQGVQALRQLFKPESRGPWLDWLAQRLGSAAPSRPRAIFVGFICGAIVPFTRLILSNLLGEDEYFLTAFPFILLVTLAAGRWAGWSCLLVSETSGWFLFIGEPFTFTFGPYEQGILLASFIVGAVLVQVADLLRETFKEIASVREKDRLLSRELEHRVKNTLTLVLSLSRQTFGRDPNLAAARDRFEGRIMALSAAQSIVGPADRQAAPLREIVAQSLAPFTGGQPHRVTCAGPEVTLGVEATTGLCLVFHELATNAAKYGALSVLEGALAVTWRIADAGQTLVLDWRETAGPPVVAPQGGGFGSKLLDTVITRQLRGTATIELLSSGAHAEIAVPLEGNVTSPSPD